MTMSMAARQDEFLDLREQHKKILFKVANLYCRNRADFADVVQEIVLQAWRSFGRYDHSRPFSTWLYRIGLNVAISFYRAEARRSRQSCRQTSLLSRLWARCQKLPKRIVTCSRVNPLESCCSSREFYNMYTESAAPTEPQVKTG